MKFDNAVFIYLYMLNMYYYRTQFLGEINKMKHLKTLSIMLSCFMAAASVQAMQEEKESAAGSSAPRVRPVSDPDRASLQCMAQAHQLGRAVQYLMKHYPDSELGLRPLTIRHIKEADALSPWMNTAPTLAFVREIRTHLRAKALTPLSEKQTEIGRAYLNVGDTITLDHEKVAPLMENLRRISTEEDVPWTDGRVSVAFNYVNLLLEGVGVEEDQKEAAKETVRGIMQSIMGSELQFLLPNSSQWLFAQQVLDRCASQAE